MSPYKCVSKKNKIIIEGFDVCKVQKIDSKDISRNVGDEYDSYLFVVHSKITCPKIHWHGHMGHFYCYGAKVGRFYLQWRSYDTEFDEVYLNEKIHTELIDQLSHYFNIWIAAHYPNIENFDDRCSPHSSLYFGTGRLNKGGKRK